MYQDIRQFIDDIRNNWGAVAERYQYARSRFFYRQDFISVLLFNRTHQKLPKTKFVDYNAAFHYYATDRKQLNLTYKNEAKTIELPYAELINFIEAPDTTITVEGGLDEYHQPADITAATQGAFQAFLAEKPGITDGPVLRMADLQPAGDGHYHTRLAISSYYNDVRTNLTLDYPLDDDLFETMRTRDLTDDGNLRPLAESRLVNHLGVFSVVALHSEGAWYFHMLPRQKNLGVFDGMLSSVSGVVEPPAAPITELVSYITAETKRELREETGLDPDELGAGGRCTIVPLALTRELSRGGKPQFFYLTILRDISEKEFAQAFKQAEWKSEFRSDVFSNIKAIDDVVSPEFSTALFYALSYIQKRRKLPADPLILP